MLDVELRRCASCDAPFTASRPDHRCCSQDCRASLRDRRIGQPCVGRCGRFVLTRKTSGEVRCNDCRIPVNHSRPCPVCGVTFVPGTSSVRGGVQLTCSRSCGQLLRTGDAAGPRRRRSTGKSCEVCGATVVRKASGSRDALRCCSRECGFELQRRERPRRPRVPKPRKVHQCRGCGRSTRPDERWRVWCSYRCRVNDIGDRVKSLYRLAAQAGGAGAQWRQLLVGYLRERDGDRCGICRRAIRFDLPSGPRGDDRGPSIDHMLPRSRGGSDDLANLRLTHWGCNRNRQTGARGEALQLALIG